MLWGLGYNCVSGDMDDDGEDYVMCFLFFGVVNGIVFGMC